MTITAFVRVEFDVSAARVLYPEPLFLFLPYFESEGAQTPEKMLRQENDNSLNSITGVVAVFSFNYGTVMKLRRSMRVTYDVKGKLSRTFRELFDVLSPQQIINRVKCLSVSFAHILGSLAAGDYAFRFVVSVGGNMYIAHECSLSMPSNGGIVFWWAWKGFGNVSVYVRTPNASSYILVDVVTGEQFIYA